MILTGFLLALSALSAPEAGAPIGACCAGLLERAEMTDDLRAEVSAQLADSRVARDACDRLQSATGAQSKRKAAATSSVPRVTISPSSFTFAPVQIGEVGSAVLTVANPSDVTVNFAPNYPNIASSSGAFEITGSTCAPPLESGDSCELTLSFAPLRTGTASGFLDIRLAEATGLFSAYIQGRASSSSTHGVLFSPAPYNFGKVDVGTVAQGAVVVTNAGNSPVTFTENYPFVSGNSAYRMVSTSCGASLDVAASCVVNVEYAPTMTGLQFGWIELRLEESYVFFRGELRGEGQAALSYSVSMTPGGTVDLGPLEVGERATASITIRNTGTGEATFREGSPEVYGAQQAFRKTASTCLSSLPVNQQCVVEVEFVPPLPGNYNGFLDVRLVESSTVTTTRFTATVEAPLPPEIFSGDFETPKP
jgi:hypothetical protein